MEEKTKSRSLTEALERKRDADYMLLGCGCGGSYSDEYVKWLENEVKKLHKHSVSNSCDCFLGFLSGEDIRMSNIKRQVDDVVKSQPELKKYGLLKGEPLTAKQLVDGRKGYISRFNFCPYCGKHIDWKTVLNNCC